MLEIERHACPGENCPDHGARGRGNLTLQFQYGKCGRWMLLCKTCKTRFSQTRGTPLQDVKLSPEQVGLILKATAEGTGVRATGRITGVSKNAVNRLILKVGGRCEKVLCDLLHGLELTELQLDELWSFIEKKSEAEDRAGEGEAGGRVWVWTGVEARTRLIVHFLVGGRTLDDGRAFMQELIARLGDGKPLFTSDERIHCATLLKEQFHTVEKPVPTGRPGRPGSPAVVLDADLDYATAHKTREQGRVVKVERKIVYGDARRTAQRLTAPPSQVVSTAYVERVNGGLRQLDARLRRKPLTFAKAWRWFLAKLNLTVACCDLIRPHCTLSRNPGRTSTPRTPAMLAGLADHPWTWNELLETVCLCNGWWTRPNDSQDVY